MIIAMIDKAAEIFAYLVDDSELFSAVLAINSAELDVSMEESAIAFADSACSFAILEYSMEESAIDCNALNCFSNSSCL